MHFEPIANGYYLEALSVDGDVVWYSDVITGGIERVPPLDGGRRLLPDRRWMGCIVVNEDGCLLSSGPGGIVWVDPSTGVSGTLVDAVDGVPLDGVNEMLPDPAGGIIFGTLDAAAIEKGAPPVPAALYRLGTDGRVTLLRDGLKFSNGICLSADGRRLYHNETFVGTFAYDVAADGSLSAPQMLLEKSDADGMAMDHTGNIWVAGYTSNEIICLRPDGAVERRIALPGDGLTNLRFGGPDGRDLFLTMVPHDAGDGLAKGELPKSKSSILYRTRCDVAGRPVSRTRFRLK